MSNESAAASEHAQPADT